MERSLGQLVPDTVPRVRKPDPGRRTVFVIVSRGPPGRVVAAGQNIGHVERDAVVERAVQDAPSDVVVIDQVVARGVLDDLVEQPVVVMREIDPPIVGVDDAGEPIAGKKTILRAT